jgi:hypothetical protein
MNSLRKRLNDKIYEYESRLNNHNTKLDLLDYYGDSEEVQIFKNEVKSRKDYLNSLKKLARNIDVSDIPSNIEVLDELIQDNSLANDIESYRRNRAITMIGMPVETTATVNPTYNADGTISGTGRNPYSLLQEPGHEGKFTAQFKARKPHLRHLKSLKEFAHYILAYPSEFNKISKQRANYYRNLIEKKGGMKKLDIPKKARRTPDQENVNQQLFENMLRNREGHDMQNEDHDAPIYIRPHATRPERTIIDRGPEYIIHPYYNDPSPNLPSLNRYRPSNTRPNPTTLYYNNIGNNIGPPPNYPPPPPPPPQNPPPPPPHGMGRNNLSKKMLKDLRAYHKQVGGKISAKDFELMLKETYKSPDKRDKHIGDYYIDESLSTPENVVYHNPKTGETKVAYRGTEGTLKDWGNNALYAFGMHNTSNRYKRSNEIQKQVEQKYGTDQLDVLGHSQSGAYAQEIGKNAKNVIVLNPAQHPLYTPKTSNATVVRSKGDAVSGLKYLNPLNWGKKKTADVEIKAETYNPVTEHLPGVLERLSEDTILGNGRKRRNKKLRRLCDCCGAKCPYCR